MLEVPQACTEPIHAFKCNAEKADRLKSFRMHIEISFLGGVVDERGNWSNSKLDRQASRW